MRVADARPDAQARERMAASFARGDLATWGYGAGYARDATDPSVILEGATRVVCVAVPYATPPPRAWRPMRGRVSNYAWSRDYHQTLRDLLDELAQILNDFAGGRAAKVACDTAPLAERAFAASAGLGWVGKHTGLISPEAGSYIFLGEIVTTVALGIDAPLRKSCGSCSRCVTACPTGALRGDYTIDATRCISDLVQRTEPIPRAMRAQIGTWVWGCDLCAVVCPPNETATASGGAAFRAIGEDVAQPDLIALLGLRSAGFKRWYKKTAMGWRGAGVLRRNAAIALGNSLDRSAVPALCAALDTDPHPMVRGAAAWALGRIGSPAAARALASALGAEVEADVRSELGLALDEIVGTRAQEEIVGTRALEEPLEHL